MILNKTLSFFSYLFHPVFIPLFGTVFFLFCIENYYEMFDKVLIIIQIILLTVLIPITFLYLLKIIGKVDSILISNVSQRKIPFLIQIFLMIMLLTKSIPIDRIPELFYFFLGGLISTILAFGLLFLKVKASIHMIGISSLTLFIIGLSLQNHANWVFLIAVLILSNGIVASSRLQSAAHSCKELGIGFFLGAIPHLFLWKYWL